jgi:excisionase family DNA binding protein
MAVMSQVDHIEAGCQADRLAPASEVAAILGVSRSTVVRLAERGDLVAVRLSPRCTRYRLRDVDALIARLSEGARV